MTGFPETQLLEKIRVLFLNKLDQWYMIKLR